MSGYRHLTRRDRYIIEELLNIGKSYACIAREIGFHRASVSREVRRNSGSRGYHARGAQAIAMTHKPQWICYPRKIDGVLEEIVVEKLLDRWSPEQISGRLKLEGKFSVSHETIYRYIYLRRRDGAQLHRCLRLHGRRRRRGGKQNRLWKKIEHREFIDKRPESANLRMEFGHWERDLVMGKRNTGALLTIVDRKSRFTLINKVGSRCTQEVNAKTVEALRADAALPCLTLTNDNGAEFAGFRELRQDLQVPIYFTNPYHSWERGTNENTNGLLRQFFPKGIDFREVNHDEIEACAEMLNSRPRKTLGYKTPREILYSMKERLFKAKKQYKKQRNDRDLEEIKNSFDALRP